MHDIQGLRMKTPRLRADGSVGKSRALRGMLDAMPAQRDFMKHKLIEQRARVSQIRFSSSTSDLGFHNG